MAALNVNDKTVEMFSRILKQGKVSRVGREQNAEISQCVVLCKRIGDNLFNIEKGIAKVAGVDNLNNDGHMVITNSTKTIFIIG